MGTEVTMERPLNRETTPEPPPQQTLQRDLIKELLLPDLNVPVRTPTVELARRRRSSPGSTKPPSTAKQSNGASEAVAGAKSIPATISTGGSFPSAGNVTGDAAAIGISNVAENEVLPPASAPAESPLQESNLSVSKPTGVISNGDIIDDTSPETQLLRNSNKAIEHEVLEGPRNDAEKPQTILQTSDNMNLKTTTLAVAPSLLKSNTTTDLSLTISVKSPHIYRFDKRSYVAKLREIPPPAVAMAIWEQDVRDRLIGDLRPVSSELSRSLKQYEIQIDPDLCMAGKASSNSDTVTLQPTIWIRCGSRKCKRAVASATLDLRYLRSFTGGVEIHVRAARFASEGSSSATTLRLNADLSKLRIYRSDSTSSASGVRLVRLAEGDNFLVVSTIGGLVRVGDAIYGLTTAHGLVGERSYESHQTSAAQNLPADDDDSAYNSDSSASSFESSVNATGNSDPNPFPPAETSHFVFDNTNCISLQGLGPVAFAGHGSVRGDLSIPDTAPLNADFLLVDVGLDSHNLNNYMDLSSGSEIELNGHISEAAIFEGPAVIILAPNRTQSCYILPGSSALLFGDGVFQTRKIQLDEPAASGISGAWVVRNDQVCGCIIARYDGDPYLHMLPMARVFQDITDLCGKEVNIATTYDVQQVLSQNRTASLLDSPLSPNPAVTIPLTDQAPSLPMPTKLAPDILRSRSTKYPHSVAISSQKPANASTKEEDIITRADASLANISSEKGPQINALLLRRRCPFQHGLDPGVEEYRAESHSHTATQAPASYLSTYGQPSEKHHVIESKDSETGLQIPLSIIESFPTLFHDQTGDKLIANVDQHIEEYLSIDLNLERLNSIHHLLWMCGRPMNARALHRQHSMNRRIIPTDQIDLHLLYYDNSIMVKPLPQYILCKQVWENYLIKSDERHKSACGLLLSYIWLIRSPLDYELATNGEISLLPTGVGWTDWKRIVNETLEYIDPDTLDKVNLRFQFGELRLGRINGIYRFHPRFILSSIAQGYLHGYNRVGFLRRNVGSFLAGSILFSLVLSAMQVGIAVEPQDSTFSKASYGFVVFFVVLIAAILAFILIVFIFVFFSNMFAAISHASRVQRRRSSFRSERAGSK